jgi:hypothetical protein
MPTKLALGKVKDRPCSHFGAAKAQMPPSFIQTPFKRQLLS